MNFHASVQATNGAFSPVFTDPQITAVERPKPGWVAVRLIGHREPVVMRITALFNYEKFSMAVFSATGTMYPEIPDEDWKFLVRRFLREQ
jgi:hypothetical protein